ncbi:hypothetical protein EYF80_043674 [Liparis tanakae]|uniref:Uncharacterized protein n=1 Tax=Liparis tanakae TaxID=230148 RepID=A0A4Z2FXU5_9TELE|nr:hypothetical protein EYF80_043674 [Liparis tanakae]
MATLWPPLGKQRSNESLLAAGEDKDRALYDFWGLTSWSGNFSNIRVEMTWPRGFSMFSSSCSSIDTGRLEMYRLVGSCSCCCRARSENSRGGRIEEERG